MRYLADASRALSNLNQVLPDRRLVFLILASQNAGPNRCFDWWGFAKMKYLLRSLSPALFLAACVGMPAVSAADSLVTTDGEIIVGAVTQTGTGYTVQTTDGPVTVASDRVRRVLYDHPKTSPASGARSVSSGSGSSHKPVDPRMIETLIGQGQAAMTAAEFGDARDAFKDALQMDHQNPLAARGLGFAYTALSKPAKALAPLEIAAQKPPLDRSLVMTLSAALVVNHNPMRAARYLLTYMQAHPEPVDEPMLNALGIALVQADSSATKSPLYQDSLKLYRKQNAELEAARDGMRRWGVEWLDKKDVDQKEADRAKAQKKVDAALSRLQTAQNQEAAAEGALNQATIGFGRRDDNAIRNAASNVTSAQSEVSKAQADYDQVARELAALPKPNFPPQIAVDDADLIVLPGAAAPTTPAPAPAVAENIRPAGAEPRPANADAPPAVAVATPQVENTPATPPVDNPPPPRRRPADPPENSPANVSAPNAVAAPARHLTRYAVAFAIAPDIVVTSAKAVENATTITVTLSDGRSMTATALRENRSDGLALLKVDNAALPCLAIARSTGEGGLTCVGYPEVDLFNPVPHDMSLTASAQSESWKVSFNVSPRLPGGPIIQNNAVVGVELGDRDGEPSSTPAATLQQLAALVADSANPTPLSPDPKKAVVQITAER